MTWGDLFCGGGGTTSGAYSVAGVKVIWALNHSASAIATHQANHPETKHFQTDILMQDEHELDAVDGIWMSSECTNHSIAKGGKLLDQGSRTLPMQLIRFVNHCKPKVIIVENVKEFVAWGPLIDGRPDKKRKGESYKEWVEAIKNCGYPNYEYQLINAADLGAYTSRLRYFGVFTAEGVPIGFPEKTHAKNGENGLPKWNPCREKLDLDYWGRSIFEKNLCPNTIKRIEAGLNKYGGDPFILSFYGSNGKPHDCSLKDPLPTITTKDRHAVVQTVIKYGYTGNSPEHSVDDLDNPISTLITTERHALVTQATPKEPIQFICSQYSTDKPEHMNHSIDNPIPTLTTSHAHMLITQFLTSYYGGDDTAERVYPLDDPIGTITTANRFALITQFLQMHYNSSGYPETQIKDVESPSPTITTTNKIGLVTQFLARHQNSNGHPECNVQSIEQALSVLTTKEKHALITQYLGDIYFRFITVDEAKRLQGFPDNYILTGTKKDQLRHIGNSVVPIVAQKLIEVNII